MKPTYLRYSVQEERTAPYTVNFTVWCGRNGRTKAFELTVEATRLSVHDTWPLRREIARHAGVDPDQVWPQWDDHPARIDYELTAPGVWLIDPEAEASTPAPAPNQRQLPL